MKLFDALSKLRSVLKAYYKGESNMFMLCWVITSRCNCFCDFCELGTNPFYHPEEELTTEQCYKLVDQMADMGISIVTFSGGEVFMRKDFLDILAYTKSHGITTGLVTNGYVLPTLSDKQFLKLKENLNSLVISVDSPVSEEHDAYRGKSGLLDRIVRGVRSFQERGFDRIAFESIIMESNYHRVPELIEFAHGLKVKKIMFRPVNKRSNFPQVEKGQAKDKYIIHDPDVVVPYIDAAIKKAKELNIDTDLMFNRDWIIAYLKNLYNEDGSFFHDNVIPNYFCFFPFLSGVVLYNGDFSPCLMLKPVANIKNVSLKEAYEKVQPLRDRLNERNFPRDCNYCFCQANTNMRFSIMCSPIRNLSKVGMLINDMYSVFRRFK
jgi:MoaA/NifB/PqqE/SkfB family radical SAM enzyme